MATLTFFHIIPDGFKTVNCPPTWLTLIGLSFYEYCYALKKSIQDNTMFVFCLGVLTLKKNLQQLIILNVLLFFRLEKFDYVYDRVLGALKVSNPNLFQTKKTGT